MRSLDTVFASGLRTRFRSSRGGGSANNTSLLLVALDTEALIAAMPDAFVLGFAPDGATFLLATPEGFRVYDSGSGKLVRSFDLHLSDLLGAPSAGLRGHTERKTGLRPTPDAVQAPLGLERDVAEFEGGRHLEHRFDERLMMHATKTAHLIAAMVCSICRDLR